tara:strand:- start:401 stop:622 length:222 start_codon:yes stop_codon:yes gene_type:complete
MIIELVSSLSITWGAIKFFNEDFFYAKQTAERNHTSCEWKYVGKTIKQDGERLFELGDPDGNKYILFKQVCTK